MKQTIYVWVLISFVICTEKLDINMWPTPICSNDTQCSPYQHSVCNITSANCVCPLLYFKKGKNCELGYTLNTPCTDDIQCYSLVEKSTCLSKNGTNQKTCMCKKDHDAFLHMHCIPSDKRLCMIKVSLTVEDDLELNAMNVSEFVYAAKMLELDIENYIQRKKYYIVNHLETMFNPSTNTIDFFLYFQRIEVYSKSFIHYVSDNLIEDFQSKTFSFMGTPLHFENKSRSRIKEDSCIIVIQITSTKRVYMLILYPTSAALLFATVFILYRKRRSDIRFRIPWKQKEMHNVYLPYTAQELSQTLKFLQLVPQAYLPDIKDFQSLAKVYLRYYYKDYYDFDYQYTYDLKYDYDKYQQTKQMGPGVNSGYYWLETFEEYYSANNRPSWPVSRESSFEQFLFEEDDDD